MSLFKLIDALSQISDFFFQVIQRLRDKVLLLLFLENDVFEDGKFLNEGLGGLNKFDISNNLLLLLGRGSSDLESVLKFLHTLSD